MNDDRAMMLRAVALARRGGKSVRPNPRVGAVLVRDGSIVGYGWHERAGGPHAEVVALRVAGERSIGATLYVTLEPCAHTGKTPPCTEAILAAEIARVVFACEDPNPHVMGGGASFLRERGIVVEGGLLAREARKLIEGWDYQLRHALPTLLLVELFDLSGRVQEEVGELVPMIRRHLRRALTGVIHGADGVCITERVGGDFRAECEEIARSLSVPLIADGKAQIDIFPFEAGWERVVLIGGLPGWLQGRDGYLHEALRYSVFRLPSILGGDGRSSLALSDKPTDSASAESTFVLTTVRRVGSIAISEYKLG